LHLNPRADEQKIFSKNGNAVASCSERHRQAISKAQNDDAASGRAGQRGRFSTAKYAKYANGIKTVFPSSRISRISRWTSVPPLTAGARAA